MPLKVRLQFSTAICVSFIATGAYAADLATAPPPPPIFTQLPAVDGVNGKFEAFGGGAGIPRYNSIILDSGALPNAGEVTGKRKWRTTAGGAGAVSFPLGGQFGAQLEGMGTTFGHEAATGVGGHVFWRDPTRGLIGVYGSGSYFGVSRGIGVARAAAEGEAYFGPFTLETMVGVETGRRHNNFFGGVTTIGVPYLGTTFYNMRTRFFDKASVAWYPLENLKLSVGQLYTGRHAMATLGAEYMFPISPGVSGSLFAEGAIGGNGTGSVRGGLKVYFGRSDKTLIRRQREDDPIINLPLDLITIANTRTTRVIALPVTPGATPPVVVPPPPCEGIVIEGTCFPGGVVD